jgi:autotransporter-associated beta strand protein
MKNTRSRGPAPVVLPALLWLSATVGLSAQSTFDARTDLLLDSLSTRGVNTGQHDGPHRAGRTGFWTAEGRLTRNIANTTTWNYLSAAITDADGSGDAGGANGGFSGWPGMDAWMRFNTMFPQNIKDQYFTEFTTMPNYGKGSTPNQKIMWASACRLACETWGTDVATAVSNAKYGYADKTGKDYMMAICDRTVKYSFEERWAKHYLTYTMGPLRSIADYTTDPALKQRARMTNNWGFADIAPVVFHGKWAVPAGRGTTGGDGNTFDISEYNTWLLMGGPNPASLLDADQSCQYIMPGAPVPTILPELVEMGTQRDQPYVTRRMARLFETQFATTYMTKDYALHSQVEGDTTLNPDGTIKIKDLDNNGVPSNDWNSERWALMWNDAPDYAQSALFMKPPTDYGWSSGSGISPYEDVVQHNGTLVGVLNIPDGKNQYTRDTIPTNTLAAINETATTGRLFLHYKTVLVSILRSDIGGFQYPAPYSTPCVKRGFALETASPSEYPQATAAERLAAFRADIMARASGTNLSQVQDVSPRMVYTTRDGTVLDMTYGQAGKINGVPVDYQSWPLSESPWTYQTQMGNMFVMGSDRTLLWNYKDWTERENWRPTLTTTAPVISAGTGSVDVDLSARVSDVETPAAQLTYRITGATNGTATMLPDGRTARFTPSAQFSGPSTFTFSAGDSFVHPRLVFHYDYEGADPVAGGQVLDMSTNLRHGAVTVAGLASAAGDAATPASLGGQSAKSLRLTGSNSGSARFSRNVYPATLDLANGTWTFSTWFNRASLADDDILFYVGDGAGFGGSGDELQLHLPAQAKTLVLRHTNAANTVDANLVSPATVDVNQWHHAAVTFEKNGHYTGILKLYLDGKLSGSVAGLTWALKQSSPLVIGGPAVTSTMNRSFNGWLDDTALFRDVAGADAVKELAEASVARFGGLKVSQTVTVQTPPTAPASVTAIAANHAVTVQWSPVDGATSYTLQRATSANGPFTTLASGLTSTSYTDLTAVFGTTYYYQVTASGAGGTSASTTAPAATLPATDRSIWASGLMNGWAYGTRIAFPGYTRSSTLTDFPVLVALDSTRIPGFAYSQFASANGNDLRFTNADGTVELPYEIETWSTSGTSYVWVKVPSMSAGTSICAFWGNPMAGTATQPGSISGLQLWLKADAITGLADGATVNTWPDSSGNNRNATRIVGTPVFKTNTVNGKPVVRFTTDGNSHFTFPQLNTIRTVFWVVKENANGLHFLLGDDNNYHFHRGVAGEMFHGTHASLNVRNGTTKLMGATIAPTTTLLGSGYRLVSVVTAGNVEASTLAKDRTIIDRSWDGDVAEVIIYDRALTAAEEEKIGFYLAQKYAMTTDYRGTAPAYTSDGSTWSNGYLGVWHLDETSGQHLSSTAGAAATRSVAVATQGSASGMVGGADQLDGVNDYIKLPDLGNSPAVTVEAWLNLGAAPTDTYGAGIVSTDVWTAGSTFFEVEKDRTLGARTNGGSALATAAGAVPIGSWTHAAYTVDGAGTNTYKLYQNGSQVAAGAGHANNVLTELCVGREYAGRYMNALMDEIRVSSVARSADWIWASRAAVLDVAFHRASPMASYSVTAAPQVSTQDATGLGLTTATLNGTLDYTAGASTTVTLYWGASDGGTTPANWASSIALGTRAQGAFSTNLTGLAAGTTYYFRALATSANGSAWSIDSGSFTTALTAPASLAAIPSAGAVGLSWPVTAGASTYTVKRSTVSGGPYTTLLSGITGTSFTDYTAAGDASYYYVVTASRGSAESAASPERAVSTVATPGFITLTPGNASVVVSWTAVPGATSYSVLRSGAAAGPFTELQSGITGTSYTDATAVNGQAYFYAVKAAGVGFETALSPSATTSPVASLTAPSNLTGFPVSAGANLTWNAVPGAESYDVKRSTTSGGPYTVIATGLFSPNHSDSGLTNGTVYYYVVSARTGSVQSANSAQVTVTPAVPPTTFTLGLGGLWNSATWAPNPPGKPIAAFDTTLIFNNGSTITSTNDMGTFVLNKLQLNGAGFTLNGDGLFFAGTGAAFSTNPGATHALNAPVSLDGQTSFSIPSGTVTVSQPVTGAGGITKSGAGTLALSGANTYRGNTIVDGGTTRLTADQTLEGDLTFGAAAGSTAVSSLDLSGASLSVADLVVQTNTATANTLTIGAGRSLTVRGSADFGVYSASTNSAARLTATGGGTLNIGGLSGSVRLSNYTAGAGVSSTVDLSGLFTLNLSYESAASQLILGNSTVGGTTTNTLTLAPQSVISVGSIRMGDYQLENDMQTLRLGTGANVINTDSISMGTTAAPTGGGRGAATLRFHSTTGTLVLRDFSGVAGTDLLIGDDGGNGNGYGVVDFNGHDVDAKIHTLRMGASTNATARTHSFSFNQGLLDIRILEIGLKQGTQTVTSAVNLGGGTVTLGLGDSDEDGEIQLATSGTGILNITGGTVNVYSDITRASGSGNATLTLNGGTLDMNSRNIGGTVSIDNVNLQAGTLRDLGLVNNGASISKTGTGTLTLVGSNAHTGLLTVAGGTLNLSTSLLGGVTVDGGTLAPQGSFGVAGSLAVAPAGTLKLRINGTTPGTGHDQLVVSGATSGVTLGGALAIVAGAGLTEGSQFLIIDNAGNSNPVSGTFAGIPNRGIIETGGYPWIVEYDGGTGNDVVLTVATALQQWRYETFGTIDNTGSSADSADADGDGFTNYEEYTNNTDPTSASSLPTPTVAITSPSAAAVSLADVAETLRLTATAQFAGFAEPLSIAWTKVSGPGNAIIGSASSLDTTVLFSAPGTYVLQCAATYGSAPRTSTGTDRVSVCVGTASTFTFRQGVAGYAHVATLIRADNTAWNSGSRDQILVGKTATALRGVYSFDLSALPPGAPITAASLDLWTAGGSGAIADIELHALTATPVEGTGDGVTSTNGAGTGATWASRTGGTAPDQLWTNPGGDFSTGILSTIAGFTASTGVQKTFASSADFIGAAQTAADTGSPLNLITLAPVTEAAALSNQYIRFASDDASVSAQRPLLSVSVSLADLPDVTFGSAPAPTSAIPTSVSATTANATSVLWSQISGPGTAVFANADLTSTSVVFTQPGGYVLRLTATGVSGETSATLAITVNASPSAPGGAMSVSANGSDSVTLPMSDPDNDPLTVTSFTQGANGVVSVSGTLATYTPSTNYIGADSFQYTVSDGKGGTATGTISVTVIDTTPPVITVPSNMIREATGASGAIVTFSTSANDAIDGSVATSNNPASDSAFPLGTTTVTTTASDAAGNVANRTFTVTVVDTTAPEISLPSNITVEATGPAGATVNFSTSASDVVSGSVATNNTPASGSVFPLGTTTVTTIASDAAGNVANQTFTVTVVDTTAPTITVSSDMTVEATGPAGATVNFSTSASDAVSGSVATTNNPASGSVFPIGTTTVTTTASDAAGNMASRTFTVTVNPWNSAPVLVAVGNKTIGQGQTLVFTASATDTDTPVQTLTYSLDAGAPAGAAIQATTGAFAWTTSESQATGDYVLTIRVTDNGSPVRDDFETITITVTSSLPAPRQTADIGSVGLAGSATHDSGTYTLQGAGAGITGSADACRFVYQQASGDCDVIVRVQSLTNTGASAKAGVMIRDSLNANALEAGVWVTPANGIQFTRRTTAGGTTAVSSSTGKTAPYWVRLTRTGNTFKAFYSTNGSSWIQFGNNRTISMASSTYIGIATTSGSTATLCTGVLTNETVVP